MVASVFRRSVREKEMESIDLHGPERVQIPSISLLEN